MFSLLLRRPQMFSPDGGFSPEVPFERRTNPVVATLMTWDARHKMRVALEGLTDHQLADIGLTRADATAEARKPFWRA